MKVLFLHPNQPDYLAESLFHGLRSILGQNCVDVPRYDSMYAPLNPRIKSKLRGYGFTLYGLLDDMLELSDERYYWRCDINYYDLIIIGNIWHQWEIFWELSSVVNPAKLVILDGHDIPRVFPYTSIKKLIINCPLSFLKPISQFKYFKRELIAEGASYGLERFLPYALRQWISLPQNLIPISFSIPKEKIWQGNISEKIKDFPRHIVDPEIAKLIPDSSIKYPFTSEEEYYQDLRKSRFGITTKRAGWDCLRHYEMAANGCVLCFKNLHLKSSTCAPHGLNQSNCIIYHSFQELKESINSLNLDDYAHLQAMTYHWICNNTTEARAKEFIKAVSLI